MILTALGLLLGVGLAVFAVFSFLHRNPTSRPDLLLHTAVREPLHVSVVERGALESADNREITCRVKSKSQGGPASTIKWVIDEGAQVQAGDKLMELDDSAQQDNLKNVRIVMETAEAAWIAAKENYAIALSQNESDIESAYLNLEVAQIKLLEYREGTYLQNKRDFEGQLMIAKSDLEMWEERAAWSKRMSQPSRRYVTSAQAQSDAARKISADLAFQGKIEAIRVLDEYTYLAQIKTLDGAVEEAWRSISRVEAQARSKAATQLADRKSKESVYEQQLSLFRDAEDEVRKCLILAPQSGMVVYYVAENTRFGQGAQSIVAQGETVKEGQKMLRIPDLSQMLVNTKVHEAMVSKVRGERWRSTGFTDSVQASLLVTMRPLLSLSTQAAFIDGRLAFTEQHKKADQVLVSEGQAARVRIDAFPERTLKAHVKTVATMASQADFMSSDVKVYQTMVSIDEPIPNLKPGMSAEVTILTDTQLNQVVTIPLQAIVGGVHLGSQRKCFVMTERGVEERDIILGASNEKVAEVKEGLKEGDKVVLNPRTLLNERKKSGGAADDKDKEGQMGDPSKKGGGEKGKRRGGPGGPGGPMPGM